MLQISPAETFPIARIISNHLDSGTYYVRAVVKNAVNDAVLATVDLEDQGSLYFRTNWKVVWQNTMSRGRYITITTSVYTDSGYTTKSNNYGDEIETYLVQERWDPLKSGYGPGGSDGLNVKDVRKVITEALAEVEAPEAPVELDTEALTKSIVDGVKAIIPEQKEFPAFPEFPKFPEIPETDLTGLQMAVGTAIQAINDVMKAVKARPEFKETDMAKLEGLVKDSVTNMQDGLKETGESLGKILEAKELGLDININGQNVASGKADSDVKQEDEKKTKHIESLKKKYKV